MQRGGPGALMQDASGAWVSRPVPVRGACPAGYQVRCACASATNESKNYWLAPDSTHVLACTRFVGLRSVFLPIERARLEHSRCLLEELFAGTYCRVLHRNASGRRLWRPRIGLRCNPTGTDTLQFRETQITLRIAR